MNLQQVILSVSNDQERTSYLNKLQNRISDVVDKRNVGLPKFQNFIQTLNEKIEIATQDGPTHEFRVQLDADHVLTVRAPVTFCIEKITEATKQAQNTLVPRSVLGKPHREIDMTDMLDYKNPKENKTPVDPNDFMFTLANNQAKLADLRDPQKRSHIIQMNPVPIEDVLSKRPHPPRSTSSNDAPSSKEPTEAEALRKEFTEMISNATAVDIREANQQSYKRAKRMDFQSRPKSGPEPSAPLFQETIA